MSAKEAEEKRLLQQIAPSLQPLNLTYRGGQWGPSSE